jgi:GPH family glycoside/pentoside/hexuronide:cation symporter
MTRMTASALLSYGAFGLPLAMVALPIYVYLPQFYARRADLSLAAIGGVLLAARIVAAFLEPLLGWWMERAGGSFARYCAIAMPLLLVSFIALFNPPPLHGSACLAWFLATLLLVYAGFGLATIAHQSWGAALTQAPGERARLTGVREACGLAGVVLAAAVTAAGGYAWLSIAFAIALAGTGALLLAKAVRPAPIARVALPPDWHAMATPFGQARFRILFAVLIVNGIAAAIPATLFLFFATDRLQLGHLAGPFLIVYFVSAAVSIAPWVGVARCYGEARAWAGAMLMAGVVFVWAFGLAPGAPAGFAVICVLSGLALGADLALPPALLAGVVAQCGHAGKREAAYFGVWNWGVQMTLALAAGIALPLLGAVGYEPGRQGDTTALAAAYALLPCALKLAAAAMLWRAPLRDI